MHYLLIILLAFAPTNLDLPPEGINVTAATTDLTTADRGTAVQMTETSPPPSTWVEYSTEYENGRCVGFERLLAASSPGWDVARMSRIAYRGSRCQPGVRNRSSSATGLLQILSSHCPWLASRMGTWCTRDRLNDPVFNIAAGATLWREQGYSAWSQTNG